ncbi:hypothetical protein ACSLBF_10410 [Pseudoalteromonas sp. T1lg65]|uniref:hypothetical protein n=1 Tax=Pseudoalteromonas sp. T1lg65 TaxID=2077101 RepID=UPI003F7943D7
MQTDFVIYQFNNLLEWLCINDKPCPALYYASAKELRQLIAELGSYTHIERRVVVHRMYQQQNTALLALIALCYARANYVHCEAPVRSVTELVISWLLSPYEAKSCCS